MTSPALKDATYCMPPTRLDSEFYDDGRCRCCEGDRGSHPRDREQPWEFDEDDRVPCDTCGGEGRKHG